MNQEPFLYANLFEATLNFSSSATGADDADLQGEKMPNHPPLVSPSEIEKNNADESDLELVSQAATGKVSAFEIIYHRYHRRTFSLCLRMTQNVAEAEDLTQEVYIQLYRKIGSFRGDSAFSTWLHRMTVNQVLMHFRKRIVRHEKTTEEGEMPEQILTGTENQNKMRIIDRIALDKAISQLPKGYRTVFVLHDVEGFEHEEIAKMLKLAIGTSKSQLHNARLKLRKLLTLG